MSKSRTVCLALARIPRSKPLRRELPEEAADVAKKPRLVLAGYRLGAILYALSIMAPEYINKLLNAYTTSCDCVGDGKDGLYTCVSRKQHALTTIEENGHEES
jgi:hypothetical protein